MQAVLMRAAPSSGIMKNILIFFFSMLPITESKAAIILGASLKLKWYINYLLSCFGSYCVVPVIVFFNKQKSLLIDKLSRRVEEKHTKVVSYMQKYGYWGLIFLLSIPFSGMGCWPASIAARVLKLDKKRACIAIFVGNAICCMVTTLSVYGIFTGIRALL